MRLFRLAILTLLVATSCTGANMYRLKLKPYQLSGSDFPMPSGLRVFFQEDHSQPSVIVTAVVGAGGVDDPPGMQGLAHLVEHLCFRAKHGDQPKVMDELKFMGGMFNAFTQLDTTTYYTVAPADALFGLLQNEAQRMLNPIEGVTQEVLDVEREVVRNELRQRTETSISNKVFDRIDTLLYPEGHPYHRSVSGSHGSLDRIKLADVQAFVDKHYRPENISIVVAGDFNREDAGKLLVKAFPTKLLAAPGDKSGKLNLVTPKARIQGLSVEPPAPKKNSIVHMQGPVDTTTIFLAWALPGAYRGDEWMMQTAVQTMTGAVGSLLFPHSMYDEDKIRGMGCFAIPGAVSSQALCQLQIRDGQDADLLAKKAIDGLWDQWDQQTWRSRKRNIAKARTAIMANLFNQSASLMRAVDIANGMHYTAQPDVFSRSMVELNSFKEFDVRNFAYKHLNRERVVVVIVEPYAKDHPKAKISFDENASWAGAIREDNDELTKSFAKVKDKRFAEVAIGPRLSDMRSWTLQNGMQVVVKKHGETPFVSLLLVTRGGSQSSKIMGISDFLTTQNEAKNPLRVAGFWSGFRSDDMSGRGVRLPSGNLAAGIDLVASAAETTKSRYESIFYRKMISEEQQHQRATHNDPKKIAWRERLKRLLGDHPLARTDYDFAALGKLQQRDFDAWINMTLAPANATLFVVGDFDPDKIKDMINSRFSSWRAKNPGQALPNLPAANQVAQRQIFLVDRPEVNQADLTVSCLLPAIDAKNQVVVNVLTSLITENLWRAIRERAGASYGVHVATHDFRDSLTVMNLRSTIQGDKLVPALQTILAEYDAKARGDYDQGKVNEVRWSLAQQSQIADLGIDAMMHHLVETRELDLPLQSLARFPQRLASVKSPEMAELMKHCAGHEVISVVGSAEALAPKLKDLGIPFTRIKGAENGDAEQKAKSKP